MNSKKKNKQNEQREDELFDALDEIMDVVTETFNKYKVTPKEAFTILNALYTNLCDQVIESRDESLTEQDVKKWLVTQVDNLKGVIENKLPLKENENEQK